MAMSFTLLTHQKCASNWLLAYCRQVAGLNGLRFSSTHYSESLIAMGPGKPIDNIATPRALPRTAPTWR
jgi:hypothetical protein